MESSAAVLPLPLYLPNLPRETVTLDFSEHYTIEGSSSSSPSSSPSSTSASSSPASKVLTALTNTRRQVNDTLLPAVATSANVDPDKLVGQYISLLLGMVADPMDGSVNSMSSQEQQDVVGLSRGIAFTWTNFSLQNNNISFGATEFEICSAVMNLGLWYLRIGKELSASKDSLRVDANQKSAFNFFCKAAGVFEHLLERAVDRDSGDQSDLKSGVYEGLVNISLAEAQAVTIIRNEGKQDPLLVCSLCRDTSERYSEAHRSIALANKEVDKKFLAFLDFKAQFFLAKAYYYQGIDLMNPADPAVGRAIRSFDAAVSTMETASEIFTRFTTLSPKSKGTEALEFIEEGRRVYQSKLDKVQGQNQRLFNDRISLEVDPLPEAKSSTVPTKYEFPGVNTELWTPEVKKSLRAKEDGISAARRGKVSGVETSSRCFAFCKPKPKKTVAIAGGGIGGLTVAHELLEKGYDVTIYEANTIFGGKAASVYFNDNLIRDHSIKNFSAYYYCLLETLKRIPYDGPIYDDDDEEEEKDDGTAPAEGQDRDAVPMEGGGDKKAAKKAKKEQAKKEKERKAAQKKKEKARQEKVKKAKAKGKGKEKEVKRTVFDNLRSYDYLTCLFPDGTTYNVDTEIGGLFNALSAFQSLKASLNKQGIPNKKVDKYLWKHIRLLFMCTERKREKLDKISYEKYLDLDVKEHEDYALIQNLVEITAAVKMDGSAWVGADQALKQLGKLFNPYKMKKQGNVLNGSIEDKFLYPWVKHIRSLGGKAYTNKALQRILVDPKDSEKVCGFQLADGSMVTADHYVVALPYSKLKYVINDSQLVDDFSRSIPALINERGEKWGHTGHFALRSLPQGATPTVVHAAMGSPWAVIFYYVTRSLWKDGQHPSEEAPVQLWITASDSLTPGLLHKKPYNECTPKEFMEELLYQIQFKEADKNLIVDTVAGHGLNWWDSQEKTSNPSVDPTTLCYWAPPNAPTASFDGDRASHADLTPSLDSPRTSLATQTTPSSPAVPSPPPAPSPLAPQAETELVNGPALHGERLHRVNDHLQIVCEAPLYAREVGMQEFQTKTPFKNLFLAGECVQTTQLCSTMEKANEAGKRCAHAVCKSDGKSYSRKKFEYDPHPLAFVRAIDSVIFGIFNN